MRDGISTGMAYDSCVRSTGLSASQLQVNSSTSVLVAPRLADDLYHCTTAPVAIGTVHAPLPLPTV